MWVHECLRVDVFLCGCASVDKVVGICWSGIVGGRRIEAGISVVKAVVRSKLGVSDRWVEGVLVQERLVVERRTEIQTDSRGYRQVHRRSDRHTGGDVTGLCNKASPPSPSSPPLPLLASHSFFSHSLLFSTSSLPPYFSFSHLLSLLPGHLVSHKLTS